MNKGDKIGVVCNESVPITALFNILAGESTPDEGIVEFGQTIQTGYLPNDISAFFKEESDLDLLDWLRQFSEEKDEQFIRGFLGRMLFAGDEIFKQVSVLSGGEKSTLHAVACDAQTSKFSATG